MGGVYSVWQDMDGIWAWEHFHFTVRVEKGIKGRSTQIICKGGERLEGRMAADG